MRQLSSHQAPTLPTQIERISSLDLDALMLQWRNTFGKRAPKGLPRALLIKMLVYRLQADALGDLDSEVARLLGVYASRGAKDRKDEAAQEPNKAVSEALTMKAGSVLIRDWAGQKTHRVMALEIGFAWEGRNYRSLSEVARAITGTRWNGRRFFGVDRKGGRGSTVSEDPADTDPMGKRMRDKGAK